MVEMVKAPMPWWKYYLKIAEVVALRSKDPSTKVGALVVKSHNRGPTQLSFGYNGFPRGVHDTDERWQRPKKYEFVLHAERNAILNASFNLVGATVYITHFPVCNECAKEIAQAGITRVVCGWQHLNPSTLIQSDAAGDIFRDVGIDLLQVVAPDDTELIRII